MSNRELLCLALKVLACGQWSRRRSVTDSKIPRAITWRWTLENQFSTWLSQEL